MSIQQLIWNYLKAKKLNTGLNILLLSLGIAMITLLILFNNQLEEKMTNNSKGIDLVVGAKGSPLQQILCSVFHVDFPTGNIKLREADRLAKHRLVKYAIPLALGDSYQGFRVVGTNRAYSSIYQADLASGGWWEKDLEVTLGSAVAHLTKLKVGDRFESAHGLTKDGHAHDENKYVVRGILKKSGTVIDELILTTISSVWKVHEEQVINHNDQMPISPSLLVPSVEAGDSLREITSLLIKYKNPIAAIQLPRFINTQTSMQAASPAFEMARLFMLLGVGADALMGFAYVLIFISGLSIFIALYNSLKERRYDMAIMRSMGASRGLLFKTIILEGSILTFIGASVGILLGHAVLVFFVLIMEEGQKMGLSAGIFYVEEGVILAGSVVLGIFCSLLPAIQAYRVNIHNVLAGS
ncbi:MAG: FtsX-like permease family protein [Cyclobacteriaceae bacterium]|nr:FtsX-like permease family protein [Cyclobacteriaceae bacterium]